jgi:hypothetical protein
VVEIGQENQIATGRRMRVDTTVVETDIHHPTDSSLLGDGVRVLTRIMKKVTAVAGKAGTQLRDRSRSAKLKVLAIARASRNKTEKGRQKMKKAYLQPAGAAVDISYSAKAVQLRLEDPICVIEWRIKPRQGHRSDAGEAHVTLVWPEPPAGLQKWLHYRR